MYKHLFLSICTLFFCVINTSEERIRTQVNYNVQKYQNERRAEEKKWIQNPEAAIHEALNIVDKQLASNNCWSNFPFSTLFNSSKCNQLLRDKELLRAGVR